MQINTACFRQGSHRHSDHRQLLGDMLCDHVSVGIGLIDKAFHAIVGVDSTLAKRRVNEAISQSIALAGAAVVATVARARDQWIIDDLLAVAAVANSVLLAVNFDGKAM
ncbi:hypothetical protein [Stieleria varia]|uniref:Uncharacterized protein n=1 Tax=Stieleria varia TaxID=2528005 RepID=A0A5C6B6V5_9BACT|nr:hypothetical protein [Stieleria varia]TWU07803.1 hypothetical protein Pla52n_03780 [Stieleria varia]